MFLFPFFPFISMVLWIAGICSAIKDLWKGSRSTAIADLFFSALYGLLLFYFIRFIFPAFQSKGD